ncbi:MAG: thiol-disulfide oxidoreductase DCC family protein [Ignavibacteria bacterium]|jgi:predicted DCC family thiol-disulfide oxidoreductase YuxK
MNKPVIFFDGVCNLCNASINFIIKHDYKKVFRYAPLQSEISKKLLKSSSIVNGIDSVVLLKNNEIFIKSDAAFEILKEFRPFWKMLLVFKLLPKFIRDHLYDYIAKNRYKWFGKKEECMVPTRELKSLFLN